MNSYSAELLASSHVCSAGFSSRVCNVSQLLPRPAFWGGCRLHVPAPAVSYSVSNTWSSVWLRVWLDHSKAEGSRKQPSDGNCWVWASTDDCSGSELDELHLYVVVIDSCCEMLLLGTLSPPTRLCFCLVCCQPVFLHHYSTSCQWITFWNVGYRSVWAVETVCLG